jgi:hypothetical protein
VEYYKNCQNTIRLSIGEVARQKIYFFASLDGVCMLFLIESSELAQQQTLPVSKPRNLLDISKVLKIDSLNPKNCSLLEIIDERVVWWLADQKLVLTQLLEDGSEQTTHKYSGD